MITSASYIQPMLASLLIVALSCALYCWTHEKKTSTRILLFSTCGLFVLSWGPIAWLTSRPFEFWYPPRLFPLGEAQAIVVLSSNVLPPTPERPISLPDRETYERCQQAAWLHNNWRKLPVLACGGVGASGGEACAITMRRILRAEGVDDSMIWTEERSRSTHQVLFTLETFFAGREFPR